MLCFKKQKTFKSLRSSLCNRLAFANCILPAILDFDKPIMEIKSLKDGIRYILKWNLLMIHRRCKDIEASKKALLC